MKRYFIIVLAVIATAACQKDAVTDVAAPGMVRIEPVITKATEVNFESGDRIGLTMAKVNASENHAENACLTYDGNVFAGDLAWYADAYSEASIYAYYPYDADGTPSVYTLPSDQSQGIEAADFMAASKTGVLPTPNSVAMVFKHLMTKIVVNVENLSGAAVEEVRIVGGDAVCSLDIANVAVLPYEGETAVAEVVAYEAVAGQKWNAIVIPQTVALELVVLLSDNKEITQPLAEMTLKSGCQYSINARLLQDDMLVKASGEIENWTDGGEIGFEGEGTTETLPVEFAEHEGYFVYDGRTYRTKTLSNGSTWMIDNLAYVPAGKTVSADPSDANGIWYPYAVEDGVAGALTDDESIQSRGYLYDAASAFGVGQVTADNYKTFEGTQGICPPGWHIPTRAEFVALCGYSLKAEDESAVLTDETALFYDSNTKGGTAVTFNDGGWNFVPVGYVNRGSSDKTGAYASVVTTEETCSIPEFVGNQNMSYFIGSTAYKPNSSGTNIQFFDMYGMFVKNNPAGKITVGYGNYLSGYSVRCVK